MHAIIVLWGNIADHVERCDIINGGMEGGVESQIPIPAVKIIEDLLGIE